MAQIVFEPNIVSCPNCNHNFVNNRVNGLALIEAVNHIEAQKRMYCKLSLDAIERLSKEGTIDFYKTKKIILDNFNDFNRGVQTILGIGQDVE